MRKIGLKERIEALDAWELRGDGRLATGLTTKKDWISRDAVLSILAACPAACDEPGLMPIEFFDEINRMLMDAECFGALKNRAVALRVRLQRWYRPAHEEPGLRERLVNALVSRDGGMTVGETADYLIKEAALSRPAPDALVDRIIKHIENAIEDEKSVGCYSRGSPSAERIISIIKEEAEVAALAHGEPTP